MDNGWMNQLLAMQAFVRVVESGSFSRAADYLHMPRSTISKLVSDLERHLGSMLIQRTTRQVTITREGQAYYEHAVRLLAEINDADESIRSHGLQPRGRLRIDVPATVARHLLIPRLPEFTQRYPDIQLSLGVGDRQINIIGEGVDCVIRGGELGDPALVARPLLSLEYGTYASPEYLARHGTPTSPQQLVSGHSIVSYQSPNSQQTLPLQFNRDSEQITLYESQFAANDGEAHVQMLAAGLGIGQHFVRFAQPLVAAGKLVPILPQWQRPAFPLYLVYPAGRLRSARLSVFIEWLLDMY